jgi:hypothetical protein
MLSDTIAVGDRVRYSRSHYLAQCKRAGRRISGPHCGRKNGFEILGTVVEIRDGRRPDGAPEKLACIQWDDARPRDPDCTILDGRIERADEAPCGLCARVAILRADPYGGLPVCGECYVPQPEARS